MKEVKKTVAPKSEEVKAAAQKKAEETVKVTETETKKAETKKVETETKKVAAETKKAAADTKKAAAKTTKKAADAAAKATKKAADSAAKVTKKAAATVKKAAAKKTVKKAPAVKETVSLQYLGKDIKTADLMEAVKNIWTGELGKDAADLKSINLYLKPEDNAAYYVINESFTGRIDF